MLKEFQSIARRIQEDFDRTKDIPHQGVKGNAREQVVTEEFLKKYLPPKYSVGSGMITDSAGNFSRQQDIVIYDGQNSPVLQNFESNKVFFAEQTFTVIEVKSTLSQTEITDIFTKAESIRGLMKSTIFRHSPYSNFEGSSRIPGIFVFALAYSSPLSLDHIRDFAQMKADKEQTSWGVSSILVLSDKDGVSGVVTNVNPDEITRIEVLPSQNSPLVSVKTNSSGEAVFFFFLQLLQALNITETAAMLPDYLAYARTAGLGEVSASVGSMGMKRTRFSESVEIVNSAHQHPDDEVLAAYYYLMRQEESFMGSASSLHNPNSRFGIAGNLIIDNPRPWEVWETLTRRANGIATTEDHPRIAALLWMLRKVSSEKSYLSILVDNQNSTNKEQSGHDLP